ncbi:hypothetical protein HS059_02370 [Mannheimia haemolytica]|uniref:hypothetical protein n=1 Tax=Mannheimia haemolytica TaxID=75985 RepID=UPI001EFEFE33|nr:hypothetical protein [Mannheimia haemolytica]ULX38335.1 hypothetical protein H1D03_04915 [Mannheimia haemolytica]ULX40592.1 hypothetical protein H1D02_02280 [Mannheimia haemolytica]ULX48171.1 hypothetical protein H1C99_09470 [Mannheimia haemolytica]
MLAKNILIILLKKVKQGKEDIKNGRIYSPEEVRKRVIAAAFRGAENAKKVA